MPFIRIVLKNMQRAISRIRKFSNLATLKIFCKNILTNSSINREWDVIIACFIKKYIIIEVLFILFFLHWETFTWILHLLSIVWNNSHRLEINVSPARTCSKIQRKRKYISGNHFWCKQDLLSLIKWLYFLLYSK